MKTLFTWLAITLCCNNISAQFVTIPDPNFRNWLQNNYPSAMSGNQMDTTDISITSDTLVNLTNLSIANLTGIHYFDNLTYLTVTYNFSLTSLSNLPAGVTHLECESNNLLTLTNLPVGLTYLSCGANPNLTNLPNLPSTLNHLDCHNLPNLTGLPNLPSGLVFLDCRYDSLSILPSLPTSIETLNCGYNLLINLPNLPNSLLSLSCTGNYITSLPPLPLGLTSLECADNNINCFDYFSNNILFLVIYPNPCTCVPNYTPAFDAFYLSYYPLCSIGNINGCPEANGIRGFTYKDNNTNCTKDGGDNGLKNIPLQIYDNTGALLGQTFSSSNGVYHFPQTANTYIVAIDTTGLPFTNSCLFPGLDSTVIVSSLDTNITFALTCKPGFDVGIQSIYTNGIIFPGQNHVLNVNAGDITHWYNLNCISGLGGTISFSVNGPVTYIGPAVGSLTPTVAGNIYSYSIADFGTINNNTDFQLVFQTDVIAQLGDAICVNATVTPIGGDNNQSNNTYTYCYIVNNSYDPNIKETYPINVLPGFNDWLTYTIHFQNTGNAPAIDIRIQDQLDTMLNLEIFQVINYSHSNLIDLTGNVLNVRFPNIQLPDSTTNSAGSIGFIQYRAKPKASWVAPYQIKNTAYIYFDYNYPIVTNTTLNSILIPTGLHNQTETLMSLYPNPSNGNFTIELNTKEKQFIQVFDITGNVILSQSIENGKAIIDGSHLASGIYNVSIKGSNSVANKKLVIVK